LALRALLTAHRLLSLALAQRLVEMRASDDPPQATLAKAEAGVLLAHLLRQAVDLLGARIDKLPERQRPHYTPAQRFRILALKSFAGLSQPEAARLFRVSQTTIARWEASANPTSQSVGSTVTPVPPVRRYNDTVHHVVQAFASLGFGGSRSLAQHVARAGWKIGKTTAARYLRELRTPGPEMRPTNSAPHTDAEAGRPGPLHSPRLAPGSHRDPGLLQVRLVLARRRLRQCLPHAARLEPVRSTTHRR
jgi:hypothetical protein